MYFSSLQLSLESCRPIITPEPKEAQPEIIAMAANGVLASRKMLLVHGGLGD